jgi:hypothetical protein
MNTSGKGEVSSVGFRKALAFDGAMRTKPEALWTIRVNVVEAIIVTQNKVLASDRAQARLHTGWYTQNSSTLGLNLIQRLRKGIGKVAGVPTARPRGQGVRFECLSSKKRN